MRLTSAIIKFFYLYLLTSFFSAYAISTQCVDKNYTLQLLGSGGPISDDARASSAEVIWINGKSKILIDAGGGAYLRFGQADARLEDIEFIGLTHFHTDHVSDLSAILKGAEFFKSKNMVAISGPIGGNGFPGINQYLESLFNSKTGSYAYLSGLLTKGDQDIITLNPIIEVNNTIKQQTKVYETDDYTIWALGIPHGNVPTLAYRINTKKGDIVISADQNGSNKAFINFAKNADVLVMPLAIDENADSISSFMHAKPSIVGKLAKEIQPKLLVLNHFMGKGLVYKNDSIKIVKEYYSGKIVASRDLTCIPIDQ